MPCCCSACCRKRGEVFVEYQRPTGVPSSRTFDFTPSPTYEINPSTRFLGAEIEVSRGFVTREARDAFVEHMNRWKMLLHNDCAFEACTSPANGDQFVRQIEETIRRLHDGGCRINKDAGCHIHIDARDLREEALLNVMLLYTRLEFVLFSMIAPHRRDNAYCRSNIECLKGTLTRYRSGEYKLSDIRFMCDMATGDIKGTALNMVYAGLAHRRTIECRLLEGTFDAQKIINWGILWASLVDFAQSQTFEQLDQSPVQGTELLYMLSPTRAHRQWLEQFIRPIMEAQSPVTHLTMEGLS